MLQGRLPAALFESMWHRAVTQLGGELGVGAASVPPRLSDRRDHTVAAQRRPTRDHVSSSLAALVVHRIGDPEPGAGPSTLAPGGGAVGLGLEGRDTESIIRFFTTVPDGVATVTLDGTYDSKVKTIAEWTAEGVPAAYRAHAYVPYTLLIEPDGTVSQMLALEARGAHAYAWNDKSIGVACIGDFRVSDPSPAQLLSAVVTLACLHSLSGKHTLPILSHDQTRTVPKHCPGERFPLALLRERVAKLVAG